MHRARHALSHSLPKTYNSDPLFLYLDAIETLAINWIKTPVLDTQTSNEDEQSLTEHGGPGSVGIRCGQILQTRLAGELCYCSASKVQHTSHSRFWYMST